MISLLSPWYISTDSTISPVKWPRYSFSRKGRRAVSRFADSWNQPLQPWNRHQQSPMIGRGYMLYPIFPSVINMLPVLHPIFTMFYQFLHPLFPWLIHGFFSDLLFFFPCCEKSRSAVARSLGSDRSTSGLRVITLPSFPWKFLAFCSAPKPPEPLGMLDFGHVLRWWISAEIEG